MDKKEQIAAERDATNSTLRRGEILWNRYEIGERLGAGRFGELWRCRDLASGGSERTLRKLGKSVRSAMNVLKGLHAMILKVDAERMSGLAAVRQIVYEGRDVYVLCDYIEGVALEKWLEAGSRTQAEILSVLWDVAEAMDLAHSRGMLHGDFSAANVLVDPEGRGWVTDFGLRPERRAGEVARKDAEAEEPGHLAPEQRGGRTGDGASDQYMLGETIRRLMEKAGGEWSGNARAAVRRATSRKPHHRFVECRDVIRAMRGERVARRRKRTEAEKQKLQAAWLWTAALAVMVGTLAGGGWLAMRLGSLPDAPGPESAGEKPHDVKHAVQSRPKPLTVTTEMPTPGYPWRAESTGMEFLWIDELQMWVGRFEVTNEEYKKKNPQHTSDWFCSPKGTRKIPLNSARQPVVYVNFTDGLEYAEWMTEQERAAGKLPEGWRYRLPGMDEAIAYIKAGTTTTYPWGDEFPPRCGNYADESLKEAFFDMPIIQGYRDGAPCTAWVDASGENAWGLFGASGNVWETATRKPGEKIFGGWFGASWDDYAPTRMVADSSYGFYGDARGAVNGFRLVLAPDPNGAGD